MLSVLPLAFFLGSQSQFGRLNPLNPRDYILLARKSLRALRENGDLKVCKDFWLPSQSNALGSGRSQKTNVRLRRSGARTSEAPTAPVLNRHILRRFV